MSFTSSPTTMQKELFFEVSSAGEGLLKLEQRQMWDDAGPADKTFSVTVKAQ